MANLPESATWDSGVYQIETTDPVLGGPNGTSNVPLKNLANRTVYLKSLTDALSEGKAPLASPALTGTPTAPTPDAGTNTTQLATTEFVQAAIAAFSSNLGVSGYQKMPSGLILQWGSVTNSVTAGAAKAVTFPIAFPNAALNVQQTASYTTTTMQSAWVGNLTATGFNSYANFESTKSFYLAIGY